jgi:hypothetical protein
MTIWTAAWSTKLPPGHTRVRISRGGPRWLPAGSYKSYSAFFPGKWFKTASPQEYLDLYNAMLAKLDPKRVVESWRHWDRIQPYSVGRHPRTSRPVTSGVTATWTLSGSRIRWPQHIRKPGSGTSLAQRCSED